MPQTRYAAAVSSGGVIGATSPFGIIQPRGLESGDLIVWFVFIRGRTLTPVVATPSGLTLVREDTSTIYNWRVFTSTSGGGTTQVSFDDTSGGTYDATAFAVGLRGFDGTTPVNADGATVVSPGTTNVCPTVTTTVDSCRILRVCMVAGNTSSDIGLPATTPEATHQGLFAHGSGPIDLAGHCEMEDVDPATGATGTYTFSASTNRVRWNGTIAIAPGSSGKFHDRPTNVVSVTTGHQDRRQANSVTITSPSVNLGDFMVMVCGVNTGIATNITLSGGWNRNRSIEDAPSIGNPQGMIFSKAADATDVAGTTYTLAHNISPPPPESQRPPWVWCIWVLRDVEWTVQQVTVASGHDQTIELDDGQEVPAISNSTFRSPSIILRCVIDDGSGTIIAPSLNPHPGFGDHGIARGSSLITAKMETALQAISGQWPTTYLSKMSGCFGTVASTLLPPSILPETKFGYASQTVAGSNAGGNSRWLAYSVEIPLLFANRFLTWGTPYSGLNFTQSPYHVYKQNKFLSEEFRRFRLGSG